MCNTMSQAALPRYCFQRFELKSLLKRVKTPLFRILFRRGINVCGFLLLNAALVSAAQELSVTHQAALAEPNVTADTPETVLVLPGVESKPSKATYSGKLPQNNPLLDQYERLRQQGSDNFENQVQLAQWCRGRNLIDQARAHYWRALLHDSNNVAVRQALNHQKINGKWYSDIDLANLQEEARQRESDLKKWNSKLQNISKQITARSSRTREQGWARLNDIDDPSAIPAIEKNLLPQNELVSAMALDRLASFSTIEGTHALLRTALSTTSEGLRQKACDHLSRRDYYEFVPWLISELETPAQRVYQTQTSLRDGQVVCQMIFSSKNAEQDVVRQYDAVINTNLTQNPDFIGLVRGQFQNQTEIVDRQLQQHNSNVNQKNALLEEILRQSTGEDLGSGPEPWWEWWQKYNEVEIESRGVDYERDWRSYNYFSSTSRLPTSSSGTFTPSGSTSRSYECLAPGTMVVTERGAKPVEQVQTGDRVLTYNFKRRETEYRAVLMPTTRPSTATLTLTFEHDQIRASGGHPFWVNDLGWVKARNLRPGMEVATVDGSTRLVEVENGDTLQLFNLVVDQNANYFAGTLGVLSHDNSIPKGERPFNRN